MYRLVGKNVNVHSQFSGCELALLIHQKGNVNIGALPNVKRHCL